jgi:hypothetical protein
MEEVVRSVVENRAWNKELRLTTRMLVTSRLAQQIDADEYAVNRRITNDDVAECRRRGAILMNEIRAREGQRPE